MTLSNKVVGCTFTKRRLERDRAEARRGKVLFLVVPFKADAGKSDKRDMLFKQVRMTDGTFRFVYCAVARRLEQIKVKGEKRRDE